MPVVASMISVSVVVPALNEAALIGGLIERLIAQDFAGDLEILVVDGQLTDETADIVRRFDRVNLLSGVRGVSAQRNLGATAADGELLIFLDADTAPPKTFVRKMVRAYQRSNFAVACPWFVPKTLRPDIHLIYGALNSLFYLSQLRYNSGAGVCIATPRRVFETVGRFDESLHIGEDVDFVRRASAIGRHRHLILPLVTSARRFEIEGVVKTASLYARISPAIMSGDFASLRQHKYEPVRTLGCDK